VSSRGTLYRLLLGSRGQISGTVYGTIVVMGTLAAGSDSRTVHAGRLAVLTAGTVIVFWLAHVYAEALDLSLTGQHKIDPGELLALCRHELAIPAAAVIPVLVLVVGASGAVDDSTAVWIAMAVGVVTLTAQGVRYARIEQLSRVGTLVSVSTNLGLGLAIVALKALVAH
jgi:hypothetical protein